MIFVILCVGLLYGAWIASYPYRLETGPHSSAAWVVFNQSITGDAWVLTIDSESSFQCLKNRHITYELKNSTGITVENGSLEWIKNNSSGYGVRWLDKDGNNFLSIEDVIYISKTGGSEGSADKGYHIGLFDEWSYCDGEATLQ